MNRKVIIALAVILPIIGVAILVSWAGSARQAAFDGAKLVPAVQAVKDIPAGTSTGDLKNYTRVVQLPKEAVPADAPGSLGDLESGFVRYPMDSGEFVTDGKIFTKSDTPDGAPENYEEVTVSLDSERGSNQFVKVGDKVAFYAAFDQPTTPGPKVVRVLGEALISRIEGSTTKGKEAPEGADSFLVTFAVNDKDAAKIIFAQKFGTTWLSLINPTSSDEQSAADVPSQDDPNDTAIGEVDPEASTQ